MIYYRVKLMMLLQAVLGILKVGGFLEDTKTYIVEIAQVDHLPGVQS